MQEKSNEFNSFGLIRFIWKWRKLLIIISIAAAIISFGASLLIRPQFKSTSIIYAPRTNSLSKILLNEQNYNERLDIKAYAVEEETEHLIQILNSREIKDILIEKFNLVEHYGLKKDMKYWQTRLYKAMENMITIKRTQYGAISVTVSDWDSQLAARMANEIVNQLDTFKNKVERERASAAYFLLEKQLEEINQEMKRIDDSLSVLAENGVLILDRQAERITQQYAIAIAQGNIGAQQRLAKELEKFAKWGPTVQTLQNEQLNFTEYQALCKSRMLDAKMDMESNMPVKFVVEKAIPADKKSYPKKLIIMILSTLATFIVTLFTLIIIENIQTDPKRKNILQAELKE
ncbi:MAG: Wzz/FepE/Etk N-terminal domain-containing protein [Bacteroidales bacterium]|jgi:capsular polysaccharide biosynthesis protein|nr:Wzz/FepE/Etk N-terminal domain-containing protein [Bacteroidales bacterium]